MLTIDVWDYYYITHKSIQFEVPILVWVYYTYVEHSEVLKHYYVLTRLCVGVCGTNTHNREYNVKLI